MPDPTPADDPNKVASPTGSDPPEAKASDDGDDKAPGPPGPPADDGGQTGSSEPSEDQPAGAVQTDAQVEEVYSQAFAQFLGPDAPEPSEPGAAADVAAKTGTPAEPAADEGQQATSQPPALTAEQDQLLRRSHLTPEMVQGWTPKQQTEFFANAQKRETDNTQSYQTLRAENDQLLTQVQEKVKTDANAEAAETPPPPPLAEAAKSTIETLVTVYGEEMKPLGELMDRMVQQNEDLQANLAKAENGSAHKDQIMVDLILDAGIRDLVPDYPSLNKAEARQRVEARFESDWKSDKSVHRNGDAPFLQRVHDGLKAAAQAEFGNLTESAAQVALANKTKQRLLQQPSPGRGGKGTPQPQTEDDVYNKAYNKHLAGGSV